MSTLEEFKELYEAELAKRLELEEACDLLAIENIRLHAQIADLKKKLPLVEDQIPLVTQTTLLVGVDWPSLLQDGDSLYANNQILHIKNACSEKNALSVSFCYSDTGEITKIVTGGADNQLHLYDIESGERSCSYEFSAPVLSIDTNGRYIACSLMDGGHALINVEGSSSEDVQRFKDHSKFVVCIRWSPDGSFLATASQDKSVNLYKMTTSGVPEKLSTLRFPVAVESIAFTSAIAGISSEGGGASESADTSALGDAESTKCGGLQRAWELIIGMRDTAHLIYLNCQSLEQRNVTLNERDWDTHVSFTPLHLAPSPDFKYLLVATDKSFHIVLRMGTNKRVRTFADHTCGDYGRPRVSWDATGKYIYSNSDSEHAVFIYSVGTERLVGKLTGHTGSVRDVVCSRFADQAAASVNRLVVTSSFDKSVRVWGRR